MIYVFCYAKREKFLFIISNFFLFDNYINIPNTLNFFFNFMDYILMTHLIWTRPCFGRKFGLVAFYTYILTYCRVNCVHIDAVPSTANHVSNSLALHIFLVSHIIGIWREDSNSTYTILKNPYTMGSLYSINRLQMFFYIDFMEGGVRPLSP